MGFSRRASASLAALAATAAWPAVAAPPPETLQELVVTAAPYAVSEESLTSSVNIISQKELDVAPPVGLGDLLSGLPGLRSTFFGPGASRPVIRGLSGPRVLILQNGVGQVDASDVSPDHAVASDPAEASRIEVLRGPSTLGYGGSAIGGVVNMIDERVPSTPARGGVDARLSVSGTSVDDGLSASGHLKVGNGPWVFAADATRRKTEDYDAPVNPLSEALAAQLGVTAQDGRRVLNSDTSVTEYGVGAAYIGAQGHVGASVRRTENSYGVPAPQIEGEPFGGDEGPVAIHLKQTRIDLRGESGVNLGPWDRIKLSTGWADYQHAEVARLTGAVGTEFLSKGYEGRLELVQRETDGLQGALGFQGLHRTFEAIGDEAFIPATDIDEAGVFLLERLDKDSWGLEGGVRVDQRRLRADNAGRVASAPAQAAGIDWATAPDQRTFTNASGSAAVFVRPAADWFVSVAVSHNERAPTEYELFADGPHAGTQAFEVGDPTLSKETVNSVEGTVRYTAARARLEGHLFHARYGGFIQETPTGEVEDGLPVQQFRPVDARFWGAEVSGSLTVWEAGARSVRLEGDYDWVKGTSDSGPIPRMPPWSITGRAIYEDGRFNGKIEVRRVAAQDRLAAFELPTDGYTMVNVFASVKPFEARDVRLFAEGRNLGDVEAREHTSFLKDIAPLPGRNFRLGVAYSF